MKKHFILAVSVVTLAACSNEEKSDNLNLSNGNVISLSASVETGITRASSSDNLQNTQFALGKSVFVEAYKTGESSTYTTGTYTTSDDFGSMTGALTYPATGENIDICAFYPSTVSSSSTLFGPIATNQTGETAYQYNDLMFATKLTGKAKGATHELTFNHALSKIIVNVEAGTGVTASDITSLVTAVNVKNTKLTASLSITAGSITATGSGDTGVINIKGTGTSNIGLIVPQPVPAGEFITIVYNGNDYTYSLDSEKTFDGGSVYTYTFTLNAGSIALKSLSISNWIPGAGDSKDITL